MNIIQSIFTDYYEHIIYELHPRPAVIENVNKMIHCGDPSYGGAMYGCPHCGNLKFVPFRCKSRFCPSCGNKYNQLRSFHMSCKLVSCAHRHCVFTIPAELRVYFLEDRTLLDCLFHSVRGVVLRMFSKMNKTENFTPGLICILHTFGRDLKWNPHIHALISEGGLVTSLLGVLSNTLITVSLVMLSAKSCLNDLPPALIRLFAKSKMKCTRNTLTAFMSVQSQIFALLISPLNTSADTSADLLLPHRVLILMTAKM